MTSAPRDWRSEWMQLGRVFAIATAGFCLLMLGAAVFGWTEGGTGDPIVQVGSHCAIEGQNEGFVVLEMADGREVVTSNRC